MIDCNPLGDLSWKTCLGSEEGSGILLRHSADPIQFGTARRATPLHMSARLGESSTLTVMLDILKEHPPSPALIKLRDSYGFTPLHWACLKGKIMVLLCVWSFFLLLIDSSISNFLEGFLLISYIVQSFVMWTALQESAFSLQIIQIAWRFSWSMRLKEGMPKMLLRNGMHLHHFFTWLC